MIVLLAFHDAALGARIAGRLLAAGVPADAIAPGPAVLAAVRALAPSAVLTDAARDDPDGPWLTQLLRGTDVATLLVAEGVLADTARADGFARVVAPTDPDLAGVLDRAATHGPPPSNLFYRALLDTAREMFALVDADVRLLFVSPALAAQAGVPAEALLGRTPIPFVHPDDAARGALTLERLCSTPGARAHGEIRLRCVGGYRTFDTYGQNRLDEPYLGAVVLAARDVTERRAAEDARSTSEGRLRALVDALPDSIARIHRHGAYLDVKTPDGYRAGAEHARAERSVFDALPAPLARQAMGATLDALASGAVQTFEFEVEPDAPGFAPGPANGSANGAAREAGPGIREARVVPSGPDEVIAVVRDVTRERRAAERETAREVQFRALFQASPDAILVASPDGDVLDANAAAERLYGQPASALVGQRLLHLAAPPSQATFPARFAALATRARTFDEWTAAGADGREVPVEVRAARVVYEGRDALLLHLRDAAERIAREAALRNLTQRLEAVREDERARIAREVHDVLGQALTALRMDAVGLERSEHGAAPAARERLGRMKALIDETIGTVRRIATELRPGILDDLGLAAALDWQARDFQRRTGLDVRVEADEAAPYPERDRATALFRIFQELLTNVARHANARRVSARLVRERGALVLTVEDDGVGLPPEAERRTGHLGLLGIRERVRPFGGAVAFETPAGGGTRVVVRVPEATGDGAPAP